MSCVVIMDNSKADLPDFDECCFDISQEDLRDIDLLEAHIFSEITRRDRDENNKEDSESEDDICRPPKRRKRIFIPSESESDLDDAEKFVTNKLATMTAHTSQKWSKPKGHQPSVIAFTEPTGMLEPYAQQLRNGDQGKYFTLMVPDAIFEEIAVQTNLFAEQRESSLKPSSRANSWKATTKNEVKRFFGLILYMGLVRLPQINLYWSKDRVFGQTFAATVMSRNRFELLMQNLHFTNNEAADPSDRISKIRSLIDSLNETFMKLYGPNEDVCVDESQVPFRGRIIFRQYNKSKRHKYGMKLFKLCTVPGYTCKLELYAGKNNEQELTTPKNVVMSLCEHILDLGHTVATDNWYTSLELANALLNRDTHLVGTLRKNKRGLPKTVVEAKLKPGESIAMENERGICILKWKDKRDVLMLSTKHSKGYASVTKKGRTIRKPKMVLAYNKAKGAVDMSDQMTSYSSPLRKTVKWYKKIGIELILNTALVNAWVIYNENNRSHEGIVQFRRQLVEHLVDAGKDENAEPEKIVRPKRLKHELLKKEGTVRNTRRFCSQCYKNSVEVFGSKAAKNKTKKVATYCKDCPSEPYFCMVCFNKFHRYT